MAATIGRIDRDCFGDKRARTMLDHEVILSTVLQPDEVRDALNRKTEIRGEKARPVAALFEGGPTSGSRFELRLIGQRNRARANIRGEIKGSILGSTVVVRIGSTDAFSVIWSAGCLIAAFVALLGIRSWPQAPAGICVAAGAIALLVLNRYVSRRNFEVSAATAELALRDTLHATRAIDCDGRQTMDASERPQ